MINIFINNYNIIIKQIKQLGTAACGISLLCISFYALIVLQGIYNTEDTKETKHDKHIAQILSIVYRLSLLVMVIYFIFGFTRSTVSTILILLMIIVDGILVIYGKKELMKLKKKENFANINRSLFSLSYWHWYILLQRYSECIIKCC